MPEVETTSKQKPKIQTQTGVCHGEAFDVTKNNQVPKKSHWRPHCKQKELPAARPENVISAISVPRQGLGCETQLEEHDGRLVP